MLNSTAGKACAKKVRELCAAAAAAPEIAIGARQLRLRSR